MSLHPEARLLLAFDEKGDLMLDAYVEGAVERVSPGSRLVDPQDGQDLAALIDSGFRTAAFPSREGAC